MSDKACKCACCKEKPPTLEQRVRRITNQPWSVDTMGEKVRQEMGKAKEGRK